MADLKRSAKMKNRLFAKSFLAAWTFLSVIGSVGLAAITMAGSALHGNPIGGPWGIFLVPVYAGIISFIALLVLAVPVCFVTQLIFDKLKWNQNFRWLLIPFTGPAFFFVLAPLFLLMGERDVFSAATMSFPLGVIVSTYWLSLLIFDRLLNKKAPNHALQTTIMAVTDSASQTPRQP